MNSIQPEYIEVKCITKDKQQKTVISPESITISDIKTFRRWHKGVNDDYTGEATVLVLKPDSVYKGTKDESPNSKTMLINETYDSFRDRLGVKVIRIS